MRESDFLRGIDPLKVAKHGWGENIYLVAVPLCSSPTLKHDRPRMRFRGEDSVATSAGTEP
jgi:hypothetical protein